MLFQWHVICCVLSIDILAFCWCYISDGPIKDVGMGSNLGELVFKDKTRSFSFILPREATSILASLKLPSSVFNGRQALEAYIFLTLFNLFICKDNASAQITRFFVCLCDQHKPVGPMWTSLLKVCPIRNNINVDFSALCAMNVPVKWRKLWELASCIQCWRSPRN